MFEDSKDIERLFNEEIHEKKVNGYGVHNRAPRKSGLRHAVMTHVDMLTGKEKREYTKGGIIVESNLYDNIIPFEEFEKLPATTKKDIILRWDKNGFMPKQIKPIWGKSAWKYSQYRRELGLARDIRRVRKNNDININEDSQQITITSVNEEKPLPFIISINKDYTGADVSKKLLNLAAYFEKEDGKFKMEVKISEIEGK